MSHGALANSLGRMGPPQKTEPAKTEAKKPVDDAGEDGDGGEKTSKRRWWRRRKG